MYIVAVLKKTNCLGFSQGASFHVCWFYRFGQT